MSFPLSGAAAALRPAASDGYSALPVTPSGGNAELRLQRVMMAKLSNPDITHELGGLEVIRTYPMCGVNNNPHPDDPVLVCILVRHHTTPHQTGQGVSWVSDPEICGVDLAGHQTLKCILDHGHRGFHSNMYGDRWDGGGAL